MTISPDLGLWGIALGLIFLLVWLVVLVQLLRRTDLDGTTKICWVVVLCTLSLVGLVLYGIFGPKAEPELPPPRRLFEPRQKSEAKDDTAPSA